MFGIKVTLISLVVAYPIILIMANYLRGTFKNPALVLTCIYLLLFSFIPLLILVNPLDKKVSQRRYPLMKNILLLSLNAAKRFAS